MIILDEPYVSQLLKDTITEMKLPLLKNKTAERLGFDEGIKFLKDEEFIELLKKQKACKIYSNSEISLVWIEIISGSPAFQKRYGCLRINLGSGNW